MVLAAAMLAATATPALPRVNTDAPVADAAMRGDGAKVRLLLKQGADVNAAQGDGMTALHWSASRGDADETQAFSDSGTFRSQLDRLFALASGQDVDAFEEIARAVVGACLTNRYYRPADYLSDIVDALDSHTALGGEPGGEPPLRELDGGGRHAKLKLVRRADMPPPPVERAPAVRRTWPPTDR
jgi:hypothetical protein